jgi:hypothetical protein
MTAIGSVLNDLGADAPLEAACDGNIPLSPLGELGATTGVIEFGVAVEEPGVASSAKTVGGVAARRAAGTAGTDASSTTIGGVAADGAPAVSGLAGSAEASRTGSAAGAVGANPDAAAADEVLAAGGAALAGAEATAAVGAVFGMVVAEVVATASTGPEPVSAGLERAADASAALAGAGSLKAAGLLVAVNGEPVLSPDFTPTA